MNRQDWQDLKRVAALFRPYAGWMALGVFLSLITLLANVVLLAISGWFITAMALAGAAGVSMNYFTPGAIIRAMAITRTVGRYLERLVTHEATFRLLSELRRWFYERLEPLAPAGLQAYRSGDLFSRIRADIDTLERVYLQVLVPVSVALLATFLLTGFLMFYSLGLALVVLALLLAAGLGLPLLVHHLSREASRRQVVTAAQMRAVMVETLQGQGQLLLHGAMAKQEAEIGLLSGGLIADQKRLSALQGLSQGGVGLAGNFALWAALLIGIPIVGENAITPASLPMLVLFSVAAFESVAAVPLAFQSVPMVLAATRRLFTIVDAAPKVSEPAAASPEIKAPDIVFSNVCFRYEAGGPEVLQGVSLEIPFGTKLALLGPTGSGKSSLINLLVCFWEPDQGTIMLGDHDLSRYRSEDVRKVISVAPQRVHLFNTTIRHNLLLARENVAEDQLRQALSIAQLDGFIATLPEGLDAFVGEAGMKLSGGQKRRLAIARALVKDAPIVILDEPSEGLDPVLETQLLKSVTAHLEGRTLVVITHSLAGLDLMDRVAVMQDGRIAESGKFAELASRSGAFSEMQAWFAAHRNTPDG